MKAAPHRDPCFPATRWTLIQRLACDDEGIAGAALAELCTTYHFPLYCFIRRRGFDHHDAEDILQDFFAKLLRLESFAAADPNRGRLRSYLATALHRFLIDWHQAAGKAAASHGASSGLIAADGLSERYDREIGTTSENPEVILDRRWAHELLSRVLATLRHAYADRGKERLFEVMLPILLAGGRLQRGQSATLATKLGMSEGAVRVALSRLLRDYRDTLEAAVSETVSSREEVPEEISYLLSLFSRS